MMCGEDSENPLCDHQYFPELREAVSLRNVEEASGLRQTFFRRTGTAALAQWHTVGQT